VKEQFIRCILDVLTLSNHPLIAELFGASQIGTPNGNHSLRRGSLSVSSTISYVYREQLSNLMATLNKTTPHFIRCIVPNYECRPFVFEGQLVLNQLR
jgi:myosin heavy subunit